MSKDFVKQYTESMTVLMQQQSSRLNGVPFQVRCKRCHGGLSVVGNSYQDICELCQGTGRVPIPWAEVMNVRK